MRPGQNSQSNYSPPTLRKDSLLYLVIKTYSLFDILTFLGTLAAVTAIWVGTIIPKEEQILQKNNKTIDTIKGLFQRLQLSAASLIDSEPNHQEAVQRSREITRTERELLLEVATCRDKEKIRSALTTLMVSLQIEAILSPQQAAKGVSIEPGLVESGLAALGEELANAVRELDPTDDSYPSQTN